MRSIMWILLRALPIAYDAPKIEEIRRASFYKEFRSSQQLFWETQIRDYTALYSGVWNIRLDEGPMLRAARQVAFNFCNRLNRLGILYPKVQRTKNVSKQTALLASAYIDKPIREITTKDLEVIYFHTGIKIPGPCEVRSSWRFNELKPRVYYCQGGSGYWASRYSKRVATALMDSIPVTETQRRTRPQHYLQYNEDTDYVVVWDYYAFTTNLSELKYFLYYVAQALRDTPVHPLRLFDYREGIIEVHPSDFLLEYNEEINIQAEFSIDTMIQKFGYDEEAGRIHTQQNNGMLGVAGNIGFSTSFHGYVLMETLGPDNGVCVGDDALGISKDPFSTIIPAISEVGIIHPEKFDVLEPHHEDPFRFIKRAWFRNGGHFIVEELFKFPIPAYADRDLSDRDIPQPSEEHPFEKRFAVMSGALLWDLQHHDELVTSDDLQIIRKYLHTGYAALHLPFGGCLPGYTKILEGKLVQYNFACPSLEFDKFDPRIGDWLEFLLYNAKQDTFSVPMIAPRQTFCGDFLVKGDIIYITSSRFWTALEDIEIVKIEPLFERRRHLEETDRDFYRRFIKSSLGSSQLCRISVIKDIPSQFDECYLVRYAAIDQLAEELATEM
jgi:hypothetical protein